MNDYFERYFNNELSDKEKENFLMSVYRDTSFTEEFIVMQNSLAITGFLPKENDAEEARKSLKGFMENISNKNKD